MGDSDPPPASFDPASLGAILADGLDQLLGAEVPFHLVGFSFGGILGGQVVLRDEARVRSFTVIGSTALGLSIELPSLLRPEEGMGRGALRELHRENLGRMMIRDPERIDALAVDIQVENTQRARIRSGRIPQGDSLARALRTMRVPVHGIWGAEDVTVGSHLADREALFRSLPHCRGFTAVEGAGHWVAYERPEIVNELLLEILAS
jgi:2-hydroxy-6-oxonona-2,4-dienedioate hydrolase